MTWALLLNFDVYDILPYSKAAFTLFRLTPVTLHSSVGCVTFDLDLDRAAPL